MSNYQKPCGYPVMDCALGVYVTKCENRIEEMEDNLRTFFQLLDLTEESDEGKPFHPITISCCRELDGLKMEKVLAQLKNIVKGKDT